MMFWFPRRRVVLAAVCVCAGAVFAPAAAQVASGDTHIGDIRAAIARDGEAAVVVEMTMPESVSERMKSVERSQAEAGTADTRGTPSKTRDVMRQKAETNRAAIADQARGVRAAMAQSNIAIRQEFENLPMFTATVTAEKLERLMRTPGVKAIYLDKPVARREIALPAAVIEKVAVAPASDERPAARTPADETAERARAVEGTNDSPEKALLANTVTYINADDAWARGFTGQGTSIAILDDGIDRNHDMFAGKIVAEACYSTTARADDVSLCPGGVNTSTAVGAASNCFGPVTACSHGSHVAGIAAGNDTAGPVTLKGVAHGANLIPVQVFTRSTSQIDCDGNAPCLVAYVSAVLNGLNFAISQAPSRNLAAVNISLGGAPVTPPCDNDSRKTAIDTLRGLGVLTTISAGNESQLGRIDPPACISTAVTVSSVIITQPDQGVNHGPTVDVLAPGVLVNSAEVNNNYISRTGTSMSAPHAAGAIAILKSAKPTATASEIETALKSGGIPTTLPNWTWSTPRIDVNRSLDLLVTVPLAGVAVPGVFGSKNPGGTSYLRFFNADQTAATVTVQVYDDATGNRVGTWTRQVRGLSSPQIAMSTIEAEAVPQIPAVASSSQFYTLFVDAPFTGYAQHVLWSPQTNLLSNVSGCDNDMTHASRYINNTHTTLIQGYTSYVLVHNTGSTAARPSFSVRDARDGAEIGTFSTTVDIKPHTSNLIRVSDVLQTLGRTPDSTQFHLNLIMDAGFTGFAQHWVSNEAAGIVTSLSAKCGI
jgi:subtilisin family serine protease